ncbi:MAG: hypothetical protein H6678_04205 [Candidatus Delongbacteria bacterium]|nr:hypothetical protein [Candidatus Delongbacteria bacterium]
MKRTIITLALLGLMSLQGFAKSMEQTSALIYYKQGDYTKALEFAEAGRDKHVQEAPLYSLLVELYARQDRFTEMNEAYKLISSVSDTEKNIQKALKSADQVIGKIWVPNFNQGVENLTKANEQFEAHDTTACRASYDQAIAGFVQALKIKPEDHPTRKALANTWRTSCYTYPREEQLRRVGESVAIWQSMLDEHPDSSAFQLEIVKLWDIPRESRKTIEAADLYTEHFGENSEVLKLAGYAHSELANDESDEAQKKALKLEAIEYMQRALSLDPTDPDLSFDMAFLYGQLNDFEKSLSQYTATLALPGLDPELTFECHKQMGLVALMASQESDDESWLERSIAAYEKAYALKPESAHVRNNLGIALLRLGAARGDAEMIGRGNGLIGG